MVDLSPVPAWFWEVYIFAVGLTVGSFGNVLVYRLPRQLSVVRPRSACPGCNSSIAWYDNIPVLSYLVLGGRCRGCKTSISIRYPLVELSVALLWWASFHYQGIQWASLLSLSFCFLIFILALIDLEHHLLLDVLTLPGIALGLGGNSVLFYLDQPGLVSPRYALVGCLLGAVIPLGIYLFYLWVRKVEGMGLGDVKLMAMVGAFLGPGGVLITLVLGSVCGALVGITLMVIGKGRGNTALPFGTFLGLGALIALFFGPQLITWYSRFLLP